MSFKVSWKLHILCFLFGYIICLIQQDNIINLFIRLLVENKFMHLTSYYFLNIIIFVFCIFIPITVVHELLHGSAYRLFGGKVKYGFKGLYAYAQETSSIALHRTQFLIVLLAPVTIISLGSVFIPGCIGYSILLFNLLGSIGDLIMAFYLCRSNKNSYIVDKSYGFDIINKKEGTKIQQ
ncbi:DUF3267 domain-containing protein [Clostridium sp.]|uniref:DUF3267 domain-containing protein n=1 Tax=Clostridium sp. TaxID=1506 RepID=UPI003217E63D